MSTTSKVIGFIMFIVGIVLLYYDFTGVFLFRTTFGSFVDTSIGLALALIGLYILLKKSKPHY